MLLCVSFSAGVGEFASHMGPGLVWRLWPAWVGAMDMGELKGGRKGGDEGREGW